MRKSAVSAMVGCVLLMSLVGCYDHLTKKDLPDDPHPIQLRVRVLDVSSSHLDSYGDDVRNIDRYIIEDDAQKLLANIFVEATTDPMYPDADIDLALNIMTRRKDTYAKAVAELVIRKAYDKEVITKKTFSTECRGQAQDTNDTIVNRAAYRAMKKAINSLRQNADVRNYAMKLSRRPAPGGRTEPGTTEPPNGK